MIADFVPDYVDSGGVRLAVYTAGPEDGAPILLIHGWPEIAYSWSLIMPLLAKAGYRVMAPDLRGFGRSDCPPDISDYRIDRLVGDIEAVLDHYGYDKAILCGHDWGGIIVWHAARMIAPRASGIISICTPHIRRAPVDPVKIYKKRYGAQHYFVHFNERCGEADALFARDIDGFFRLMFRTVPKGTQARHDMFYIPEKFKQFLGAGSPPLKGQILTDAQRAVFVKHYARSGFTGGINLYRNTGPNWEYAATLPDEIDLPVLMISPEDDLLLPPNLTDPMPDMIPDLNRVTIPDCSHWAMWEQPDAVATAILEWLA